MTLSAQQKLLLGAGLGASAGLGAGYCAPDLDLARELGWFVDYVTYPTGRIFLRLLFMLAVPLIFSALVVGVGELDIKSLGRVGGKTLAYTIVISAIAVTIGLVLVNTLEPGVGQSDEVRQTAKDLAKKMPVVKPPDVTGVEMFIAIVPDNPVKAAATGDMVGLIVFALIFGVGVTLVKTPGSARLFEIIQGMYDVTMRLIAGVLRLAPIGVGALLFTTMATLGIDVLVMILAYVGVVLLGLGLHMFVVYPVALVLLAHRSPLAFFRDSRLAISTAFTTSSSSATLPTALRVAEENLGIPTRISRFVLTAGASMNQNGTALFEGVTVLFLAQLFHVDLSLADQAMVMLVCVLGGIGTAGIPGGSLPVVAMILVMFEIPPEGLALVMGVDRFLDMCRTTLNVTGDLVAAAYIARSANSGTGSSQGQASGCSS